MTLSLQQIIDIDAKTQVMQVSAWISFTWKDYRLQWDPDEYGGIKDVRFPSNFEGIWKPDILLYNSVDDNFDTMYKSNLVVYNSSVVNWIPPAIFKFSCMGMSVTWFPFDDQMCELKFSSWTYHGMALNLSLEYPKGEESEHHMDLSTYIINGEWDLISTKSKRSIDYFTCCPEPYVTVLYRMHMRRRTLYYGFNLIIPSLLITLMTIMGFTFPPDAGEKITLEITILLSVCFFLSMVGEMTPSTSESVPLIGVFFSCCMLVVSASVVFTVVVLNLHFRSADTHVMSPLVKKILLEWLPWLFMMSRPGYRFRKGKCFIDKRENLVRIIEKRLDQKITSYDPGTDAQLILLHRLYTELEEITKRFMEEDEKERIENDWKFAAMVVDRVCLVIFTLFISLFTCALMFSAPHIMA